MPSMSALTTFTDGAVVHQADLNNLSTNIDALCQITTGKTAASGVSTKPMAMVHISADKLITNNVDALISWDVADYNTDNMWVGSQPTQFTVQTAGKYRVNVVTVWANNASGIRSTKIMVNGTSNANVVTSTIITPVSSIETAYTTTCTVALAANATVYLDVFENSGSNINVRTTFGGTWATIEWCAP